MQSGKKKGSAFERRICRLLSEWWSGGKSRDVFWRIGSSGSVSSRAGSKQMAGDIVQVDMNYLEFPFLVECKHVKTYDLYNLFEKERKANQIMSWIEQCERDAKRANKIPMLVMKRNYFDALVMIEKVNSSYIKQNDFYKYLLTEINKRCVMQYFGKKTYYMMKLKDLLCQSPLLKGRNLSKQVPG